MAYVRPAEGQYLNDWPKPENPWMRILPPTKLIEKWAYDELKATLKAHYTDPREVMSRGLHESRMAEVQKKIDSLEAQIQCAVESLERINGMVETYRDIRGEIKTEETYASQIASEALAKIKEMAEGKE